jgi:nucleoside-diphosphate-sugar epimerase
LIAAVDVCGPVHGEALVVSNGEPRPVAEVLARLSRAAGVPGPGGRLPFPAAWVAGAAAEGVWAATRRRSVPPLTRFLAEQLATAHWFDQRRTRTALRWQPTVNLDEGFRRLSDWYSRPRGPAGRV